MTDLADSTANAARRRLVSLLRNSIAQSDFGGGALPPDDDLALEYGASRAQVRDALTALAQTGQLTRVRGVGTRPTTTGALFHLLAFHGVGGVPDMDVHPKGVTREVIPTPALVAARLPGAGAEVMRIEYVSAPDGEAHGVSTSYFVLPKSDALRHAEFGRNLYSLLDSAGLRVRSSEFLFGAFAADEYTAARLRVAPGAALLSLDQVLHDDAGIPLAFTLIALRGDRFQLVSHERTR